MAYMYQELKKEIAPKVKDVLNKYGLKGSLRVYNHSTLSLTITSGKLDLITEYNESGTKEWEGAGLGDWKDVDHFDVNVYHLDKRFEGETLNLMQELKDAMNNKGSADNENFDNSDIMTDYFNVGWYIDINVGKYDKPYVLIKD